MKNFKLLSLLVPVVLLGLWSCANDDGSPLSESGEISSLDLNGSCDYYTVPETHASAWTIESTPGWVTAVASKGGAGDDMKFYVESNTRAMRSGEIKICYANGSRRVISVRQSVSRGDLSIQRTYAVGWGFDIRTNYDFRGLRDQIFNTAKLNDFMPDAYVVEKASASYLTYHYGESATELSQNINGELNVDAKYNSFKLDIQGKFGKEAINDAKRIFAWIRNSYQEAIVYFNQLDMLDAQDNNLFTADFADERRKVIEADGSDESIRTLIDKYGTHLVSEARLGGFYDYYYSTVITKNVDNLNIEAAINFGFSEKFKLNADVKYKDDFQKLSNEVIEKFSVKGGDAITLSIAVESGTINQSATDMWLKSLRDSSRYELTGFRLMPISVLFPEEIEKKIENYVERMYYFDNPLTRSAK